MSQAGTGQSFTLPGTQKIRVDPEITCDLRQTPLTARRETNRLKLELFAELAPLSL